MAILEIKTTEDLKNRIKELILDYEAALKKGMKKENALRSIVMLLSGVSMEYHFRLSKEK